MCTLDADGCYVLAKTTWFFQLCSVDIGEALGPYQALQWVIDLGFDDMNFSLDSKVVVGAFNSGSNNNTEFGSII